MIRYFAIVVMLTILLSYSNLLGTEKKKGEAVPHRKWVGNISADGKQIIFVEGAVIKDVVFAGAHNLRLIYEKGKETSSICIADLINGEKNYYLYVFYYGNNGYFSELSE